MVETVLLKLRTVAFFFKTRRHQANIAEQCEAYLSCATGDVKKKVYRLTDLHKEVTRWRFSNVEGIESGPVAVAVVRPGRLTAERHLLCWQADRHLTFGLPLTCFAPLSFALHAAKLCSEHIGPAHRWG